MLVISALLSVDEHTAPYAYFLTNVSEKYGTALTTEHLLTDDVDAWNGKFRDSIFIPSICKLEDVPIVHRSNGAFVKHAGKYSWCLGVLSDRRVRLLSVYGKIVDVDYDEALRLALDNDMCNASATEDRQLLGLKGNLPLITDTAEGVWTGAFTREPKVGDVVAKDCFDIFGDPVVRAGDILTNLQVSRLNYFRVLPPILDATGLSEPSVRTLAEHSSRFYVDLGEAAWLLQTIAEGREVGMDTLRKGLPTIPSGGIAWVIRLSELDSSVACHCLTVSQLVGCIARDVLRGKSEATVERAMLGALLHDVGKLKLNQNVLEAGRKLSLAEFDEIKSHSQAGYDLLKNCPSKQVRQVALTALRHHVKKDGKGYPQDVLLPSLRAIDLVVQFCDIFSALLAKRQYKESMPPMKALRIVCQEFEELVIPRVAKQCADAIQNGLVGATVQMRDGAYGKIIAIEDRTPVGRTVVELISTGECIMSDGTPDTEPLRILGV